MENPAHVPAGSCCSLRAKLLGLVVTLGALTAAYQGWLSRKAPATPAQLAVQDADLFPRGSGPQRASYRCRGCPPWALEPGEDPALYAKYSNLPRVTLNPDGTPPPEAVEALRAAWSDSTPVVIKNYIPAEHLTAWQLDNAVDPSESELGMAMGQLDVEVLRYAERGQREKSGHAHEDYRTRLMPVDSSAMKLDDFLHRSHQQETRSWPEYPMTGEMFMFKRKVPRGYVAVPPSKRGTLGPVEEYTRDHTSKPKPLWEPVGEAGACSDPKDGSSRFSFDDPMLRMQTPFFTFPVHYDCYGNVLAQLAGQKRVVVFPRAAVKGNAMESHEIFDVDMMITPEGVSSHAVGTAILQPGEGLFIPMGYFHTVASGSVDHGGPQAMGISINFPVMCDRTVYHRATKECEAHFARDFPHRQQELRVKRDYAGGASFNAPKGLNSKGRRRRRSGASGRRMMMNASIPEAWDLSEREDFEGNTRTEAMVEEEQQEE